MAKLASQLCNVALQRVRDPSGIGHSRSFVIARLSDAQRMINAMLGVVTDSVTLTTTPYQTVYSLSGLLTSAVRVVGVREEGRDLARMRDVWRLAHINRTWFRETGDQFQAWTMLGRDVLAIYPAKVEPSSVTIQQTRLTTVLGGEDDPIELPDEYGDLIVELTVAILLLKQRQLLLAKQTLKHFMMRLGIEASTGKLGIAPTPGDETAKGATRES